MSILTEEMIEKAMDAANALAGGVYDETYATDDMIRAALLSVLPEVIEALANSIPPATDDLYDALASDYVTVYDAQAGRIIHQASIMREPFFTEVWPELWRVAARSLVTNKGE